MKQLIFVSLIFLFISCSSDSDESQSNTANQITPPSWIQGTWSQRIGSPNDYTYLPTFRFKPNDFCSLNSNIETCFGNSIQQSNGGVTSSQVINENEYKLTITINGSQTTTYHFLKINDTKIEYVVEPSSVYDNLELFKE